MMRLAEHPGLRAEANWREIAYATGDETWPAARVRVTPQDVPENQRLHQPNAAPMPLRVAVRFSASLIDAEGAVERVAGRLLLGPEQIHSWQFDEGAPFDPEAWIDQCAGRVIDELLKQARGIAAAAAAGLIAPAPQPEPEPEAPPFVFDPAWMAAPQGEA